MQVVTERHPTEDEWGEMLFAWKVCKHVRSNAIVLGADLASVGIGAGQMSRVDSVRLAIEKAPREHSEGAAMASDAFFPFADGPQLGDRGRRHRDHPARRLAGATTRSSRRPTRPGSRWSSTRRRHFRH
jgi:phosphoribosylaminoimidazolecarboxamide formyltransferase/IMP cyclohydrolase